MRPENYHLRVRQPSNDNDVRKFRSAKGQKDGGSWMKGVGKPNHKTKNRNEQEICCSEGPKFGNYQAPTVTEVKNTELIKEMSVPRMQDIEDLPSSLMPAKKMEFMTPEVPVTGPEEEMKNLPQPKEQQKMLKRTSGKVLPHSKNPLPEGVDMRSTLKKMAREKLVQTANREFNLDVIQERFLKTPIPEESGLTNRNLIAELPMFKSIMKAMAKEDEGLTTYRVAFIGVRNPKLRKAYMHILLYCGIKVTKSQACVMMWDGQGGKGEGEEGNRGGVSCDQWDFSP